MLTTTTHSAFAFLAISSLFSLLFSNNSLAVADLVEECTLTCLGCEEGDFCNGYAMHYLSDDGKCHDVCQSVQGDYPSELFQCGACQDMLEEEQSEEEAFFAELVGNVAWLARNRILMRYGDEVSEVPIIRLGNPVTGDVRMDRVRLYVAEDAW